MERLRIIVGGYIGLYPTGGATWDYIQYLLGLKMLGHDVYYIEDTLQYPIFQDKGDAWNDATFCISYLKSVMEDFDLKDKWAYRDIASGQTFGMTEEKILALCESADVFINISCSTFMRDEYLKIPKRVLIDSDPMFTQIQYAEDLKKDLKEEKFNTEYLLNNHNYLFTFGENISSPDSRIPRFDFDWKTTRQPICLTLWESDELIRNNTFTSVMNWSGRAKLIYENEYWGQKDVEFEKYKEIPMKLPDIRFEVVINKPLNEESHFDSDELKSLGWRILEPDLAVGKASDYKKFILNSMAEISVAKETYVKSRSGWFSCRSACYLAAGKPVVAQETGWSKYIHSGDGLFVFTNVDSAIEAVKNVKSNIAFHSKAAKQIAHEYFDSNLVLTELIEQLN